MNITTDHPASHYGIPVIVGDDREVMDYAPGIQAARKALGLTTAELAAKVGKSRRTVEGYESGRIPPAEVLYVMAGLLAAAKA